jgi:hypothetical protein
LAGMNQAHCRSKEVVSAIQASHSVIQMTASPFLNISSAQFGTYPPYWNILEIATQYHKVKLLFSDHNRGAKRLNLIILNALTNIDDFRDTIFGHKICLRSIRSNLILDCQILNASSIDFTPKATVETNPSTRAAVIEDRSLRLGKISPKHAVSKTSFGQFLLPMRRISRVPDSKKCSRCQLGRPSCFPFLLLEP